MSLVGHCADYNWAGAGTTTATLAIQDGATTGCYSPLPSTVPPTPHHQYRANTVSYIFTFLFSSYRTKCIFFSICNLLCFWNFPNFNCNSSLNYPPLSQTAQVQGSQGRCVWYKPVPVVCHGLTADQ